MDHSVFVSTSEDQGQLFILKVLNPLLRRDETSYSVYISECKSVWML
jgi:hypothetical protein